MFRFLQWLGTAALLLPALVGQTPNASLGGSVTDSSGAVLPNAIVTVTNLDTGVSMKAVSNPRGVYDFPSLQEGRYRLTAELNGFQPGVYAPVLLDVSANIRLNFTLKVAGSATSVEVTAAAESPLLTTSSNVGGVIQGQQVLDLPLVDQNATNLAITQPGFAGGIGSGVNVAGGSTQALMVTVNGIDVTNKRVDRNGGLNSGQLSQSVDMVEELKVVSSPVDAELGRALGSVQMIVRSGSNRFHGSAVDGLRNTDLNANTFFNNLNSLPRSILKRNQFAARLGGPIRHNKTFFFFVYDGNRQVTSSSVTQTVLTATARHGIFRYYPGVTNGNANSSTATVDLAGNPMQPSAASGALQSVSLFGIDPNRLGPDPTGYVQKILASEPLPNSFIVGDGLNTAGYQWLQPAFSNRDQETFKIDHYFTPNHHLNVVFTREVDSFTNSAPTFPGEPSDANAFITSYFASLGFTSTLKPTLLNEVRIGFQHPDNNEYGSERAPGQSKLYPVSNGWKYTPTLSTFSSGIPGNNDFDQVDPVYTYADTMTWIKGRHSVRWGGEADFQNSNAYNIVNGVVPSVTFGAGPAAVTGISSLLGIGGNQTLAQNMLTDLSGSISQVSQGYNVPDGRSPAFTPGYTNRRNWHQRGASAFIKDDFKFSSNLTINMGVRWDWFGVPWDSFARTPVPVGGVAGLFGISGTNDTVLWQPGIAQGAPTAVQVVGKNSPNGGSLYNDYFKGFAPALGMSWSIPYFGRGKTVLRVGYSLVNSQPFSMLGIDNSVNSFSATSTFIPSAACNLNCVSLPLPFAGASPIASLSPSLGAGSRTQLITAIDANFRPPITQNWNISIERDLPHELTFAARYVGNAVSHLMGGTNLDAANIFENGILNAFVVTQQGGNAPLFDQIFKGQNLGLGAIDGTTVTASASLRQYSAAKAFFANNEPGVFANYINTTTTFTPGIQGGLLARAGLPQNFITVNPQYLAATEHCSCTNSSYNALVLQVQKRFSRGLAFQFNYTFSKALGVAGGSGTGGSSLGDNGNTAFRDPRNWSLDKQLQPFDQRNAFKASGTYELPFGPGRPFLAHLGVLSRVLDHWQLGGILTLTSGSPLTITATAASTFTFQSNSQGGVGVPPNAAEVVGPLPSDIGKVTRTGNGVIFFPTLTQVKDPGIANLTTQQGLQSSSVMYALAQNGQVLIQNPAPGNLGNLAIGTITGPSLFDLDVDMLKQIRVREHYSVEFRVDAISVTNTPHFGAPTTDINSTTFGRITAVANNTAGTPAIYTGGRVFVANLRFTF
jgi:hypothetical protein